MNRLIIFENFKTHPRHSKYIKKLKTTDIDCLRSFILINDHLNKSDFESKLNRFFLDKIDKPKNYKIILDLLSCVNSAFTNPIQ